MSLKGPQDRVAWAKASELGINIHTTEDGGIELLRDNLAPNQYGLDIDEFGNADGYPIEVPQAPTGRHVFVSDVNGAPDDVRRQTLTPVSVNEPWWDFATPFVNAGARPPRDPRRTADTLPRPPAPVVEAVAVGIVGFPEGNRKLLLTRCTADGRLHTEPGDSVDFFLNEGEGLKVFIPRSTEPADGIRVGIWITEVDGSFTTARLQRVVSHDIREVILDKYVRGRVLPTRDETALTPPKPLRRRNIHLTRDDETLKNGEYRFARFYWTAFGSTKASGPSPRFTINEREKVEQDRASGDEGEDKETPVVTGMRRRAFAVPRPPRKPGATGWGLAVQFNGAWYIATRTASTKEGARIPFGTRKIEVNGKLGAFGKKERFSFMQEELPEENTSGIEPLDSAPETPVAVTLSGVRPTSGKRYYSYADVITDSSGGERMSLPSPTVSFTTVLGEIARVKFPDTNNLIENSEGRIRKADGTPEKWVVGGANGSYLLDETGLHTITTNGIAYATDTKRLETANIPINPDDDYCLRANLAASIVAGTASIVVEELDEGGLVLNTITLCNVNATGSTSDTIRIGPNGDIAFTAGTVSLLMRVRMNGASRNMIVWAWDMAVHPYTMSPRKVVRGEPFNPASFESAPAMPFPKGVVAAVGPAPSTAVELEAPDAPEIFVDTVDFTTLGSFPPTGWTHSKTPSGLISQLTAGQYWKIDDNTTGSTAKASLTKDYTADIEGDRAALRVLGDYPESPGNQDSQRRITFGKILNASGATRVVLFRNSTNKAVMLRVYDKNGDSTDTNTGFTILNGDEVDYEIQADGAGGTDGRVRFYAGKNGAARSLKTTVSGVDWTGQTFGQAVVCAEEWDRRSTWEIRPKHIAFTEDGYIGTPSAAPPPPTDLTVLPDRPSEVVGPDTFYRTWDEDGEIINQLYIFVPPGTPRFDVEGFARWAVIPGETYSFGVYGRHEIPAGEEGSLPWYLTLHNLETGEVTDVGSPYGDGASGISGWSDRQKLSFTVPAEAGYVELRASMRNMGAGLFLWQEWAYSKAASVSRGYGVANGPEQFYVFLDSRTPGGDPTNPKRDLIGGRLGMGLIPSELPTGEVYTFTADAGTDVLTATGHTFENGNGVQLQTDGGTLPAPLEADVLYYVRDVSGDTLKLSETLGGAAIDLTDAGSGTLEIYAVAFVSAGFTSSDVEGYFPDPEETDPALVPEATFYRITGVLQGFGRETPYIPPAGPYVVMEPLEALLLRSDRTELPGGMIINGLDMPPERAWFQTDTVGGNRRAVDVTDPVIWTNEVTLEAYTEDGMTEFNERWWEDWIATVPYLDNGNGLMLTLRFKDEVTLQEEDIPRSYRGGHRWVWAKGTATAQVIAVEPLV